MNSNTNSAVLQSKSIVNDSLRHLRRAKNSSSSFSAPRDSQDISSSDVSSTTDFVKENGILSLSASEYVKESHEESKEEESENELEIDQEALTEPEQELESESGPETESKPETVPGSSQESKPLVGGNQAEDEEEEGAEKDHSSRRKIIKASKRPSDITIECSPDGMIKKIRKSTPKDHGKQKGSGSGKSDNSLASSGGGTSRKRSCFGLQSESDSGASASKYKRSDFEVNTNCAGISKSQVTFISSESEYSDLFNERIPSRFGFTDSKQGIPPSLYKNFEDCQQYLHKKKSAGYVYLYSKRPHKFWKKNTSEWEEGEKVNGICIPAEIAVRWFQSDNCRPFIRGQMTGMVSLNSKNISGTARFVLIFPLPDIRFENGRRAMPGEEILRRFLHETSSSQKSKMARPVSSIAT